MLNEHRSSGTEPSRSVPIAAWFGGKSKVAHVVWRAFGNVPNYVEPFFGSGAVLLGRPHEAKIETVNDRDCVAPSTRILKADLTWARAEDIQPGDRLVGFDESNGPAREGLRAPTRYRRLAHATVTGVRLLRKPCYRLTFDDGTQVVASANHLWLGGSHRTGGRGWRWLKTENMVCNRKNQRSWVLKVTDVVEREESFDAGWLGGILDGEGSIKAGPGLRCVLAQNEGPVLDRAERLLAERGYRTTRTSQRRCKLLQVNVGMAATLSMLMRVRPERLIAKLSERLNEISLYGRSHRAVGLVSKEFLGEQTVVAIETDCSTFIAEGLASHNCYLANFWRAVQHDPEAVAHHCDWPVNEADLHARHRWLVEQHDFRERMLTDPGFFDARIAGWWVWGLSQWIGGGWCTVCGAPEQGRSRLSGKQGVHKKVPNLFGTGNGVHRKRPVLGHGGRDVVSPTSSTPPGAPSRKLPNLSTHSGRSPQRQIPDLQGKGSKGVHRLPSLGNMRGVHGESKAPCADWFAQLQARLRRVRVCCGDWTRVLGDSVLGTTKSRNSGMNPCGLFLDPPYSGEMRDRDLYATDDANISKRVAEWALAHGDDPDLRIALCGYEGEHEMPSSWHCYAWKAHRGYAGAENKNVHKERIWFSPHCLPLEDVQGSLFDRRLV